MGTTTVTPIIQELLVLQQQRATGELVITHRNLSSPQWRLYFYLGRLIFATGGVHSVRRWYRAFKQHCSKEGRAWLAEVKSDSDFWEMDLLDQAVHLGYISAVQTRAIVQSIAQEVLFALVRQPAFTAQWNANSPNIQQATFLSIEQVLNESQQLCQQWLGCGAGDWQDAILQISPDFAPVVRDAERLQTCVSPSVYSRLMKMMQGNLTLWDLAVCMQRSLPVVFRSLLPLIRQGAIELREIPDLLAPVAQLEVMPSLDCASKRLIACIDDNPNIGQALMHILQPAHYELMTILNPLQGVAGLLERKPDLIFLDLAMPNMNGYEFCTFLRKTAAFQDTPIVALTRHDGVVDRVRAKLAGSSDFLCKPPEAIQVLQVVQRHLGAASDLEKSGSGLAIA
jgi:two-component system, chemotaxis family, response regulator PixG